MRSVQEVGSGLGRELLKWCGNNLEVDLLENFAVWNDSLKWKWFDGGVSNLEVDRF